jgi:uncharacterized protein (DUF1800 family)
MRVWYPAPRAFLSLALFVLGSSGATPAQPPEVQGVSFSDRISMFWSAPAGAATYHVYRSNLLDDDPARCHAYALPETVFAPLDDPDAGDAFLYLVTATASSGLEGTPGTGSEGQPRPRLAGCESVVRTHVMNRVGYGWSEWTRDRVDQLGVRPFLAEQLTPTTISELTNTDLNSRLASVSNPQGLIDLIRNHFIRTVYARRQLEQAYTTFWTNHFNTDWSKIEQYYQAFFPSCVEDPVPQCDFNFPIRAQAEASRAQYREVGAFRILGFEGNFREMLGASAASAAMIIYLDTISSAVGAPNENYPREVMELHTMGVDAGYTQTDVEELARVLTGWSICKKLPADLDDPLAPCLDQYWNDAILGSITATYVAIDHDCTAKTLFANTPQELTIPDTCGNPMNGVQDLNLALDAIVTHPATARFISRKILERFVTEDPDEGMIDVLVDVWKDSTNTYGVGDLKALLGAALDLDLFLDPNRIRTKIKTPLEHFASAMRATRGSTDGSTSVLDFLVRSQHVPYFNPTPTGWPEGGGSWIGTNNMLERQNFGIELLGASDPDFRADSIGLLIANGVPTEDGHAEEIVDFFGDVLFGGAWTEFERQAAIDFLNTDDTGVPSPYDAPRIRSTVAFLLGYVLFQEQ